MPEFLMADRRTGGSYAANVRLELEARRTVSVFDGVTDPGRFLDDLKIHAETEVITMAGPPTLTTLTNGSRNVAANFVDEAAIFVDEFVRSIRPYAIQTACVDSRDTQWRQV